MSSLAYHYIATVGACSGVGIGGLLASWVESRWGLGGVSVDVHRVHRVRALISRVMLIVEYEW